MDKPAAPEVEARYEQLVEEIISDADLIAIQKPSEIPGYDGDPKEFGIEHAWNCLLWVDKVYTPKDEPERAIPYQETDITWWFIGYSALDQYNDYNAMQEFISVTVARWPRKYRVHISLQDFEGGWDIEETYSFTQHANLEYATRDELDWRPAALRQMLRTVMKAFGSMGLSFGEVDYWQRYDGEDRHWGWYWLMKDMFEYWYNASDDDDDEYTDEKMEG